MTLLIQLINRYFLSCAKGARDTLINKTEEVHDLTELTLEGQGCGGVEWGETGNICMNKKPR